MAENQEQFALTEEQAAEIRQVLISAGGDLDHINGLKNSGLVLTVFFAHAGHSVAKLCPPPTPAWEDWGELYGER